MSAPWTKEQSERWAEKSMQDAFGLHYREKTSQMEEYEIAFLAGLAKAAEIIEASPTVYGKKGHPIFTVEFEDDVDTHQAKLVCVKPIDEGET